MKKNLKIGIAGLGTVGQGVFKILSEGKEMLEKRSGCGLEISAVSARSKNADRGINLNNVIWLDNPLELASHNDIDIVVELIGGSDGIALELARKTLESGKHFVTANKALIAHHGMELAKLAEKNNVSLLFEAAVAGAIPVLKTIREGLSANKFHRISGIMNGTCNYILTEMKQKGSGFNEVLKDAKAKGYAEADPAFDIGGTDAAHKLAIISALAYNTVIDFDSVYVEGITDITINDINYASEMGYEVRLLGITKKIGEVIEQRVHPCLVPVNSPLAAINGVTNAVLIESSEAGDILLTGAGAGEKPTASAVVADIMDIASGRTSNAFGVPTSDLVKTEPWNINKHNGEYYIRVGVKDESGVLASLTSLLNEDNIGVETIVQKADSNNGTAQVALTTHKTSEKNIKDAIEKIAGKDYVIEKPHMIRII